MPKPSDSTTACKHSHTDIKSRKSVLGREEKKPQSYLVDRLLQSKKKNQGTTHINPLGSLAIISLSNKPGFRALVMLRHATVRYFQNQTGRLLSRQKTAGLPSQCPKPNKLLQLFGLGNRDCSFLVMHETKCGCMQLFYTACNPCHPAFLYFRAMEQAVYLPGIED